MISPIALLLSCGGLPPASVRAHAAGPNAPGRTPAVSSRACRVRTRGAYSTTSRRRNGNRGDEIRSNTGRCGLGLRALGRRVEPLELRVAMQDCEIRVPSRPLRVLEARLRGPGEHLERLDFPAELAVDAGRVVEDRRLVGPK